MQAEARAEVLCRRRMGGPRHRYYSGFVAFCSRDGLLTNRLKRPCIHGTYFSHCAWCRLSPTRPGGPSEGHGFYGGAGTVRGSWRRRPHGTECLCTQESLYALILWRRVASCQVNTLPKAKSKTRSKQNKDMHKCSSVYSERGVPLPVFTSGGE